jgi:hypothetical protein
MLLKCNAKDKKLNIFATIILIMGEVLRLLQLRLRQIWRLGSTVGWLWIIALPILFIFFLVLLSKLQSAHPALVYVFAFLLPVSFHYSRKDARFLKKSGYRLPLIFSLEYLWLALIILLPVAILSGNWFPLIFAFPGALALALLPMRKRHTHLLPPIRIKFISVRAFEWVAGIRQYGWGLIIIYILGLAGSYWVAPPLIAILLFSILLPGFYDHCEPKEWMENLFSQPNHLLKKSGQHALLLILFLLPLMIPFLFFSMDYWYVLLLALSASLLYLLFSIFYKYANYYPGRRKVQNGTVSGLMALGLFLPFTAPVAIGYICLLFFKAKNRLRLYLNR